MSPLSTWFETNGDLVQLIYGLSIAAIGAVIIFRPKKGSRFKLAGILWLFAGYAFLHAPADFIHMRSLTTEAPPWLLMVAKLLTFGSYLFLFEFGRRVVGLSQREPPAWLLPVIVICISVACLASPVPLRTSDALFGYMVRLPAGAMAGIGLYWFYHDRQDELGAMDVKRYFMGVGIALLAWAFFCGAVRTEAPFFPSNWLNKASFFETFSVPVYVFRTACALVCVWGLSGALKIFNYETLNELDRHRGRLEDLVAKRTTELSVKHQTEGLLNSLLSMSVEGMPLQTLLKRALTTVSQVPWLTHEAKAAIFLVNQDLPVLELTAKTGGPCSIPEPCQVVQLGECLCGRAAQTGSIQFSSRVGSEHERGDPNADGHGHYCVPISSSGTVLGVLSITLPENHLQDARLESVLSSVANVLASIIERSRVEASLRETELEYQAQLRGLASRLALAEEAERRQIATGLHDQVGQNLAMARMTLGAAALNCRGDDAEQAIKQVQSLLAQVINDTRSLTFELSPPVLYELGLECAIEWLLEHTEKQHGLAVRLIDDGRDKPLTHDVAVLVFRAVRELLFNVVKHAHAERVDIEVDRVGQFMRIQVCDDGVGLKANEAEGSGSQGAGFGLFSIRERMNQIGGAFEIEAAPSVGTRAVLTAPIDHEAHPASPPDHSRQPAVSSRAR